MVYGAHWLANRIIALCKILLLCLCAWFLPRIFVLYAKPPARGFFHQHPSFRLGIENIPLKLIKRLARERIGLVTNQTGRDRYGQCTADILREKGVAIAHVLAPDDLADQVSDVDVFVFDMQDVGTRHTAALYNVLEVAARQKKKVIVLDRPNPLGTVMEGPLQEKLAVPRRHGMTVGELADYCNKQLLDNAVDLEVVPMKNYNRKRDVPQVLLTTLSPDIKSINAYHGHSFLGLLSESDVIDVGVGTNKAFQCLMLPDSKAFPKQKWYELHVLLQEHGVESKFYSCFNECKKKSYSGLQLHIRDINTFSGLGTALAIVDFFKKAGINLELSHVLPDTTNVPVQKFFARARESFMYYPLPQVIEL